VNDPLLAVVARQPSPFNRCLATVAWQPSPGNRRLITVARQSASANGLADIAGGGILLYRIFLLMIFVVFVSGRLKFYKIMP